MSHDLREYAKQTNKRLIIGALLLLFIVGDGLIWLIYGREPAIMGLMCMGLGLVPVGLIYLILLIMDWIVKRSTEE